MPGKKGLFHLDTNQESENYLDSFKACDLQGKTNVVILTCDPEGLHGKDFQSSSSNQNDLFSKIAQALNVKTLVAPTSGLKYELEFNDQAAFDVGVSNFMISMFAVVGHSAGVPHLGMGMAFYDEMTTEESAKKKELKTEKPIPGLRVYDGRTKKVRFVESPQK